MSDTTVQNEGIESAGQSDPVMMALENVEQKASDIAVLLGDDVARRAKYYIRPLGEALEALVTAVRELDKRTPVGEAAINSVLVKRLAKELDAEQSRVNDLIDRVDSQAETIGELRRDVNGEAKSIRKDLSRLRHKVNNGLEEEKLDSVWDSLVAKARTNKEQWKKLRDLEERVEAVFDALADHEDRARMTADNFDGRINQLTEVIDDVDERLGEQVRDLEEKIDGIEKYAEGSTAAVVYSLRGRVNSLISKVRHLELKISWDEHKDEIDEMTTTPEYLEGKEWDEDRFEVGVDPAAEEGDKTVQSEQCTQSRTNHSSLDEEEDFLDPKRLDMAPFPKRMREALTEAAFAYQKGNPVKAARTLRRLARWLDTKE